MSAHALAQQLFAPPGSLPAHTRHLLAQAAGSHARLLDSTARAHEERLDRLRDALGGYLRGPASPLEKRRVLDDPQFVEALHGLAASCDSLAGWDAAASGACRDEAAERAASLARSRLGNIVAAVLLRRARDWCGRLELATDDYGRVHFPFCDWTLVLASARGDRSELFARQPLRLDLDERQARWSLAEGDTAALVRMPRKLFDAMFVDNRDVAGAAQIEFGTDGPRPRFERASLLGHTPIRFEPIAGEAPAAHAELTGGIVTALVEAIERNAPHIHNQLCQCVRTIQGFELPPHGCGHIASFSVPTCPGVIGFNVAYTPSDEPQLSPYCFMWLGHELGHTLNYLIDDVAYTHGWRFLENPLESTALVPRYGRSLYVRTLFQIPYVHLFEWWLLMLFHERGFDGLPWRAFDDTLAVGDDVRSEIEESFELIRQYARLTPTGRAVVARLHELVGEADAHWRRLRAVDR
jgi:hypothetical protein